MIESVIRKKDVIAFFDGYVSTFFTFTTDENAKEAMRLVKHVAESHNPKNEIIYKEREEKSR